MRLIQISTFYPSYLAKYYAANPNLAVKPYDQQKSALLHDSFGWSDFWPSALSKLGYSADVVIANAESLQKAWADEQGISYTNQNWITEIIEAQILRAKPEILFIEDYALFSSQQIETIRQRRPSIRLVIGSIGAPYKDISIFKSFDLVFSCIPEFVTTFNKMGIHARHLHHAFEPRILSRIDLSQPQTDDFTFIGQVVRGNLFHTKREKILEQLNERCPIKIYTSLADLGFKDIVKAKLRQSAFLSVELVRKLGIKENRLQILSKMDPRFRNILDLKSMPQMPINPQLKPFLKPGVFGIKMFQTLRNSKVTFNNHIDASPHSASNMRLFEATGVGTCLLTDWKENIRDLFEPDREIVTYKSVEECIEKVRWLLENPDVRTSIAQAGQRRTLKDHTFTNRAEKLDIMIRELLNL